MIFTQVKVTKHGSRCAYVYKHVRKISLKSITGLINIAVQRKKRQFNFESFDAKKSMHNYNLTMVRSVCSNLARTKLSTDLCIKL